MGKGICEDCGREDVCWLEQNECRTCLMQMCLQCYETHECVFKKEEKRRADHLIERAEKLLGPIRKWEARCYEISCAFLDNKLVKGTPRYGHWLGPVAPGTRFDRGLGFTNHGWIELKNKEIVDPTRWVFEDVDPYIFSGPDTEKYYDIGGNRWYAKQSRPIPKAKPGDVIFKGPKNKKLDEFIRIQLLRGTKKVTLSQAFWLANRPPEELHPFCKQVYEWLVSTGRIAFIPVENRLLVLEK